MIKYISTILTVVMSSQLALATATPFETAYPLTATKKIQPVTLNGVAIADDAATTVCKLAGYDVVLGMTITEETVTNWYSTHPTQFTLVYSTYSPLEIEVLTSVTCGKI